MTNIYKNKFTAAQIETAKKLCKETDSSKCDKCPLRDVAFCSEILESNPSSLICDASDNNSEEHDNDEDSDGSNIEYNGLSPIEILNFFRNRYYNDGNCTERGIVANAINDTISKMPLPPCLPGNTLYGHNGVEVIEYKVSEMKLTTDGWHIRCINHNSDFWLPAFNFGVTIFFSRKDAHNSLKGE